MYYYFWRYYINIYTGQSARNIYGKNHYISEILENFLSFLSSHNCLI